MNNDKLRALSQLLCELADDCPDEKAAEAMNALRDRIPGLIRGNRAPVGFREVTLHVKGVIETDVTETLTEDAYRELLSLQDENGELPITGKAVNDLIPSYSEDICDVLDYYPADVAVTVKSDVPGFPRSMAELKARYELCESKDIGILSDLRKNGVEGVAPKRSYGFFEEMEMIDLIAGHVFGTNRDRELIERFLDLTGFPTIRGRLIADNTAYARELIGAVAERGF